MECNKCDGDGYNINEYTCNECDGKKIIYHTKICQQCNGDKYYDIKCNNCLQNGYYKQQCNQCNGKQSLIYLDLILLNCHSYSVLKATLK